MPPPPPPLKPILKKPPGYKDPTSQSQPPKPAKPPAYRKPVLPPSFYHRNKKSSLRKYYRICYCCACVSVLLLLVCLAVAGGIFYLWFAPKPPVFRLRQVQFRRFSVTEDSDGTSTVDARVKFSVEVKNPNRKLTVYYGETLAAVAMDGDTDLGSASVGGLTQRGGNTTVLRFVSRTSGSGVVVDLDTGKRLNATVKNGAVKLKVELTTKVGIGVGKLKVGMWPLDVACGGASLNKLKGGSGTPPNCKINWFRWRG